MLIDFACLPARERQQWLCHAVAPRPIALVSSISVDGAPNLAPFSFFNMISSEPPLIVFSVQRRLRDATTKHTIENILAVPEIVVHVCTRAMAEQASLASHEFGRGVDEFVKAGFTKQAASLVRPFIIQEAPVALECLVQHVIPLGEKGGSSDLVIAEVLCMEVQEAVLTADGGMIDQLRLLPVSRLGGPWYGELTPGNLFSLPKPDMPLAIGVDQLPEFVVNHQGLTARHLALLAGVSIVPAVDQGFVVQEDANVIGLLEAGKVGEAWQVLLIEENLKVSKYFDF